MTVATSSFDELRVLSPGPVDERAARATLRGQIARLEGQLASLAFDLWSAGRTGLPASGAHGQTAARWLELGELEQVRDELLERIEQARVALEQRAEIEQRARARLERMLADPVAHRFAVVPCIDLGEPSCGAYQVRPRLGLLGMLFGWWRVKLSSGCPLSHVPPDQAATQAVPHEAARRSPGVGGGDDRSGRHHRGGRRVPSHLPRLPVPSGSALSYGVS
jgi:hypothetical protein